MIDTHCHIDLYPNPHQIIEECERLGIITVAMTNLPSHFEMGKKFFANCKYIRCALGMHPLYSESHAQELPKFIANLEETSYVGEVGLDFSKEGYATKDIQLNTFSTVLKLVQENKKLVSLHSRRAEKEVFQLLLQYEIEHAIFHWYTGPATLIDKITNAGYFFSINPAMIKSTNGQDLVKRIPREFILTESDGPFIENAGKPLRPSQLSGVLSYLANLWKVPVSEVEKTISQNFKGLIASLKY